MSSPRAPGRAVPIHTASPERFAQYFRNVSMCANGGVVGGVKSASRRTALGSENVNEIVVELNRIELSAS